MLKYFLDMAAWAWKERTFLRPIAEKYFNTTGEPPVFDGNALKRAIVEYEPTVFMLYKSVVLDGNSVKSAIIKLILGHRQMTRDEEEEWFKRASGTGEY